MQLSRKLITRESLGFAKPPYDFTGEIAAR